MMQNKWPALIRPDILKRIFIYSGLFLILGVLQTAFFPMLSFCPATPDLIIGALAAIALLDGKNAALVCAVAAGFFIDAIGSTSIAASPLFYFIFALIICFMAEKMLKSFPSFLLLLLPSLLYRALMTTATSLLSFSALVGGFFPFLLTVILPEAVITLILCLPLYLLVKLCVKPLEAHGKFTF